MSKWPAVEKKNLFPNQAGDYVGDGGILVQRRLENPGKTRTNFSGESPAICYSRKKECSKKDRSCWRFTSYLTNM